MCGWEATAEGIGALSPFPVVCPLERLKGMGDYCPLFSRCRGRPTTRPHRFWWSAVFPGEKVSSQAAVWCPVSFASYQWSSSPSFLISRPCCRLARTASAKTARTSTRKRSRSQSIALLYLAYQDYHHPPDPDPPTERR